MASENSYEQLIDDYENGIQVIEGETLTEYIKRMGGVEYANGGGVGSMMQPKKKSYKDQKLTKKTKPANQGGGPNYLGKQKEVTVPKKWLSSPDHVVAELAYITPREQKILLDADLYGSLKGKPNKGPGGIMSLQGDLGGWSSGSSGSQGSGKGAGNTGQGKGGRSNEDYKNTDHYKMMTGQLAKGQTTTTGPKTRKYAVPEYVNVKQPDGTYKNSYVGSGYKSYGQPSFFGNLFSRGAPGYRGIKGMPAFGNKSGFGARQGPEGFGYYSDNEDFGETRDPVPFGIMGLIANAINKFKKPKDKDMSQYNELGLFGQAPEDFELGNKKISNTSFSPNNKLPPAAEYEGMWDGRNNFGNPGGTTNSNFAIPGGFETPPPAAEYEGMWDGRNNFGNPGGTTNSNFAIPGGIVNSNFANPGGTTYSNFGNPGGTTNSNFAIPGGIVDSNFANPGGTTNSNFANPGGDAFPYKNSINNAAMEVMSNAYKDRYYGGAPGDNPTSVYEAPFGLNYPGGEPRAVVQNDKTPLNEDARFASMPVNSFNSVFNQNTGDPYSDNLYDQEGNYIGLPFARNGGIMGYGRG